MSLTGQLTRLESPCIAIETARSTEGYWTTSSSGSRTNVIVGGTEIRLVAALWDGMLCSLQIRAPGESTEGVGKEWTCRQGTCLFDWPGEDWGA